MINLIALSSIMQMLKTVERFSHNNLDTLWFFFEITAFIFIALIVWLIIAGVSKNQDVVISSEIPKVKAMPNDPFLKDASITSDMSYKLVSQDELNSSRPNYLISSSPGEDELDMLQSEIKLYEDSLLQEKDFGLQKDFSSEDMSDNIYGTPSGMDFKEDYSYKNSRNDNVEFEERSSLSPPLDYGKKSKLDVPLPEKSMPFSSIPSSRKNENGLKIDLPRKDMTSGKDKKADGSPSFSELSTDRAGPMKAMRIELPQKGKISEPKKDSPPLSKGGRIDLPRKMSN